MTFFKKTTKYLLNFLQHIVMMEKEEFRIKRVQGARPPDVEIAYGKEWFLCS